MASPDSADLPPRIVNGRKAPRNKTYLGGKLVYGDGTFVRDCTIRDLSETGAKIALPVGEFIPERIFLLSRHRPIAYDAKISWIRAPQFGLSFIKAYQLKGELPSELEYLRQIWGKLCVPLDGRPSELLPGKLNQVG
jgi:hypothetical protein